MANSSAILYMVRKNGKVYRTCKTLAGARRSVNAMFDRGIVLADDRIEIIDSNNLSHCIWS